MFMELAFVVCSTAQRQSVVSRSVDSTYCGTGCQSAVLSNLAVVLAIEMDQIDMSYLLPFASAP